MSANPDAYFKMAQLYKLGRVRTAGAVADELRQSLPVPVIFDDGELRIYFMFCPSTIHQTLGSVMYPPEYLARFHITTARLELLQWVRPEDFKQKHDPTESIGNFTMPKGLTATQFLELQQHLFGLYDQLLPVFANHSEKQAVSKEFGLLAAQFKDTFARIGEPPLHPYYRVLGAKFFSWLDEIEIRPSQ